MKPLRTAPRDAVIVARAILAQAADALPVDDPVRLLLIKNAIHLRHLLLALDEAVHVAGSAP